MTVSQAKQIALDFLGPSTQLDYCGINEWPTFFEIKLNEDHHVFKYDYDRACRIGSSRYIGVAILENSIGFNNRCTMMDFGE